MTIKIQDINTIQEAAQEFIQHIGDARVFAFYGKMGAGKTTFVKAICEALGCQDVITSPTFAIVNEYTISFWPLAFSQMPTANSQQPYTISTSTASRNWRKCTIWAMRNISIQVPSVSLNGLNW